MDANMPKSPSSASEASPSFGVKLGYGFAVGGLALTQNIVPVRSQLTLTAGSRASSSWGSSGNSDSAPKAGPRFPFNDGE